MTSNEYQKYCKTQELLSKRENLRNDNIIIDYLFYNRVIKKTVLIIKLEIVSLTGNSLLSGTESPVFNASIEIQVLSMTGII